MKLNHECVLSSKKCPAYIFEWFYNQKNAQTFPKASWKRGKQKVCSSKGVIYFSSWFCSTMITHKWFKYSPSFIHERQIYKAPSLYLFCATVSLCKKRCWDRQSFVYLPSLLYHPYLVSILFWHAIPVYFSIFNDF